MTTRQQYYDAIARLEGYIEDEFFKAVRAAVDSIPLSVLEDAIKTGDLDRVMAVLDVSDQIGALTANAVHAAFIDGMVSEGANLRFMANVRSPRAEAFLRDKSSEFITYIRQETRETIRDILSNAMTNGQAPISTALTITGRINKTTGRREGGIIGLNRPQANAVIRAEEELYLIGRQDELSTAAARQYLSRARRDKRYDLLITRAMAENKPIGAVDRAKILGRYADNLLNLRGQTIARTESIAALNAGREESLNQAVISGDIPQQFVERIWDATMDARTRKDHVQMNGQKRGYGMPFTSPLGSMMMHPADSSLGASAADVVNCRCFERIRVDHIGIAKYKASLL